MARPARREDGRPCRPCRAPGRALGRARHAAALEGNARRKAEGLAGAAVTAEIASQLTVAESAGVDLSAVVESLAVALGLYLCASAGVDEAQVVLLRRLAGEPAQDAAETRSTVGA